MATCQNSGQDDFKIMLKVHYETVSYEFDQNGNIKKFL